MQRGGDWHTRGGRKDARRRERERGREVSGEKGRGDRRTGVSEKTGHAGLLREQGCGRTDLLPGSHVPPARNGRVLGRRAAETGEEENEEE